MTFEGDVYGLDIGNDDGSPAGRGWTSRHWWAYCIGLLVGGTVLMVWGAASLSNSTFGTSLRATSCDLSTLPGMAMLSGGALALMLGLNLCRLRHVGAVLTFDPASLAVSTPIPATLLAATLPGVLGCSVASDIAQIGLVGEWLVGQGGMALCFASAALLGAAFASSAHVSWLAPGAAQIVAPTGIVERAVLEAEALEEDLAAQRFRGVDPEH